MKSKIQIGNLIVSEESPVVVIAEAACEHRGSMDSAKRLIDAAKYAGADIIKFQLHIPEEEMIAGSIKFWAGSMDDVLKEVNFEKKEQHEELKRYCEKVGIQYLCTPFCSKAVDVLEEVGVDAYKTGSGELTNIPMMRRITETKKPMIVSTGMSTMEEIQDMVDVLRNERASFMLMHCLSEYPAEYSNLNLKIIPVLKEKFSVLVGYSDHTIDIYSTIAAVTLGAKVIEKHFTIRDLNGPDNLVSLDPGEFKKMVGAIRDIEKSLGDRKYLHEKEKAVRAWAHHSIVSALDIKTGKKITPEMLTVKRPGTGIPSKYIKDFLGKTAKRDITKNILLTWEDVE